MATEKLTYLKRFRPNAKLVELSDMTAAQLATLPSGWIAALKESGSVRVSKILDLWKPFKDGEFDGVFLILSQNLAGVDLVQNGDVFSLMYEIHYNGEVIFYEGGNPDTKVKNDRVAAIWSRLPQKFSQFYDTLHNGWYHLSSASGGPAPVEHFSFLDQNEWGILEDLEEVPVALDKTVSIFTNGGGGYICLEFNGADPATLIWWADEAPEMDTEGFWPLLDSWTAIALEG